MKILLTVIKQKKRNQAQVCFHKFNSVTEAYRHYLKYYSTFGNWFYYLRCAHTLLNKVEDEETMQAIFDNVFSTACISRESEDFLK